MVPETIDYNMMFIDDHENKVVQVSQRSKSMDDISDEDKRQKHDQPPIFSSFGSAQFYDSRQLTKGSKTKLKLIQSFNAMKTGKLSKQPPHNIKAAS